MNPYKDLRNKIWQPPATYGARAPDLIFGKNPPKPYAGIPDSSHIWCHPCRQPGCTSEVLYLNPHHVWECPRCGNIPCTGQEYLNEPQVSVPAETPNPPTLFDRIVAALILMAIAFGLGSIVRYAWMNL